MSVRLNKGEQMMSQALFGQFFSPSNRLPERWATGRRCGERPQVSAPRQTRKSVSLLLNRHQAPGDWHDALEDAVALNGSRLRDWRQASWQNGAHCCLLGQVTLMH
jgi:hypothetical protein